MANRCAAEGASTCNVDPMGDMVECVECGSEVRWDMQDHPFWGFKSSCPNNRRQNQPQAEEARKESR